MDRDWTMQVIDDLRGYAQTSGVGGYLLDLFNAIADGVCDDETRCRTCPVVCYIRAHRESRIGSERKSA